MVVPCLAFRQSIESFKQKEKSLTQRERQRILAISAFADEMVPRSTSTLRGISYVTLPVVEHLIGIGVALTLSSPMIARFLHER